jgi:putative intracellular protease/amidase
VNKLYSTVALSALIFLFASLSCASAQTPRGADDKRKLNVAILVFDGVQIIDYTGPYEVLGSMGRRNVYTVAEKPDTITTNMGMRVIPNYTFDNQPRPDILIIPGGGVGPHLKNQKVINWIQESARQARYVMSVCNGAFFLGQAGLLDGLEATTTAGLINGLKTVAPKSRVVSDKRFVDNGKIITTAGLSSGIDGALHLVEKLDGKGWAQIVATNIEYDWRPDSGYARANLADMKLPSSIYDLFFPGAEPINIAGGADSWEEKWDVSSSSPSEFLRRIGEKWAADARWKRSDEAQAKGADSDVSRWRLTDERGQTWDASASVEPSAGAANRLTLTLKIARAVNSARLPDK